MRVALTVALVALAASIVLTGAQAPPRSAPAVFTAAEADAGRALYQARCAGCHMPDLTGRNEASPLAGPNFLSAWVGRTTGDLGDTIAATMPPGAGGTLGAEAYRSLTAFILQANGAIAGTQSLGTQTTVLIGNVSARQSAVPAMVPAGTPGRPEPPPPPRGLTVSGEVPNFVPVTDEMLRNPPPGDWLMARRNYQAW